MYNKCFGIKSEADAVKVKAFIEQNNIDCDIEDNALSLFENAEAKFRITLLHTITDEEGNPVEVDDDIIETVSEALGNGEYFDYDLLDNLVAQALESIDLVLVRE